MLPSGLPSHSSTFVQSQKRRLKSLARQLKLAYVTRFRQHGSSQLATGLKAVSISTGDTVVRHSSYFPDNGFPGSPGYVLAILFGSIGPYGTLLMSSSPYNTST